MRSDPPWVVRCRPAAGAAGPIERSTDPEVLAAHLTDAARVPGGHAAAIALPETEAAVASVLTNTPHVLAIGAQSSLTGGATPRGELLLSTARLATIGATAPDHVVVGPGCVLADLATELGRRGQWYPPLPTYDGATVGGTVATNAAGAATFKYGATRAWVRALTVVLASGDVLDVERGAATASPEGHFEIVGVDGRPHRVDLPRYTMPAVAKLAAGYFAAPGMDLVDLFVGAEGTLGIVTSVTLGVVAPPPAWLVGWSSCADEAAALRLAADLRAGVPDLAAIEYLDARALAFLHEDGIPARLRVPLPAAAGAAILFQVALDPETRAEAVAAALADPEQTGTALSRLARVLADHDALASTIPALPGEAAHRTALFALREAVPLAVNRRVAVAQRTIHPTLAKSGGDVVVPPDRLAELLAVARSTLRDLDLDHAIWGHLSDGNLHPNVVPRRPEDGARAATAQLAIGAAAIALGGSPLSEHGVGRSPVKQALLRQLYGDDGIAAMRRVKAALDPDGVLAPGVIFPVGSV
jgi:D-lactate dehydrogenase (cytochrome)